MAYDVPGGYKYPSVTNVQKLLDKPWAMPWVAKLASEFLEDNYWRVSSGEITVSELAEEIKNCYKDVRDEAIDIGKKVHEMIKDYIKAKMNGVENYDPSTGRWELNDQMQNSFLAFLEWEEKNVDEWLYCEKMLYSNELALAGTPDAIYRHKNGKVYLGDWKSSKDIYQSQFDQAFAYLFMAEERILAGDLKKLKNLEQDYIFPVIIRLDKKTGMPDHKSLEDIRGGYKKKRFKAKRMWVALMDYYYKAADRRLGANPVCEALKLEVKSINSK